MKFRMIYFCTKLASLKSFLFPTFKVLNFWILKISLFWLLNFWCCLLLCRILTRLASSFKHRPVCCNSSIGKTTISWTKAKALVAQKLSLFKDYLFNIAWRHKEGNCWENFFLLDLLEQIFCKWYFSFFFFWVGK